MEEAHLPPQSTTKHSAPCIHVAKTTHFKGISFFRGICPDDGYEPFDALCNTALPSVRGGHRELCILFEIMNFRYDVLLFIPFPSANRKKRVSYSELDIAVGQTVDLLDASRDFRNGYRERGA